MLRSALYVHVVNDVLTLEHLYEHYDNHVPTLSTTINEMDRIGWLTSKPNRLSLRQKH